jgi:hypothetical protein
MAISSLLYQWQATTQYHYRCPRCGRSVSTAWAQRLIEKRCPHTDCGAMFSAPMPGEDSEAWVDDYDAPYEMACAVFTFNGRCANGVCVCSTPGCGREATMVAHDVPYDWTAIPAENPGKTCVANLVPVCAECKLSASSNLHLRWLADVSNLLGTDER